MEKIKADLHMHGPIGFQDYWLKVQGYEGKNLLKEITDSCLDKGVNMCANTSDEDDIPRGSIHDRFNWLKENNARELPLGYKFDTLGDNVGIVSRLNDKLYLVNGQTVRTGPASNSIDYLVVGLNSVPNHKDLEYTVKFVKENENMFGGAEHAFCTAHEGMGEENLRKLSDYMTFIEGHNSQLVFPVPGIVPVFGNYRRGLNDLSKFYAEGNFLAWIATSDAHRIEDAGLSYIEFDCNKLDTSSEDKFFQSLEKTIHFKEFTPRCRYSKFFPWVNWVSKFMAGITLHKDKVFPDFGKDKE